MVLGELDDRPGAAGEVVGADAPRVELGGPVGEAVGGEDLGQALLAGEGDEPQLPWVARDDGAAGAGQDGGGPQLVDVAGLVEDDQVEHARHRGQEVLDVGDGADPQRHGAEHRGGVDGGERAAPLAAVADAQRRREVGEGAPGGARSSRGRAGLVAQGGADGGGGVAVGLLQGVPERGQVGAFGGEAGHGAPVAGRFEGAGERGGGAVGACEGAQAASGEAPPEPGPPAVVVAVGAVEEAFDLVEVGLLQGGELVEEEGGGGEGAGAAGLELEGPCDLAFEAVGVVEGVGGGPLVAVDLASAVAFGDARAEPGGELVAPFGVAELDGQGAGVAVEEGGEDVGGVDGLGGDEDRAARGDGVEGDGGERVALAAAGRSGDDGDRLGAGRGDGGGLLAAEREGAARRRGVGDGGGLAVVGVVDRRERGGVEAGRVGPVAQPGGERAGGGLAVDVDDGPGDDDEAALVAFGRAVLDRGVGESGGGGGLAEPVGVSEEGVPAFGVEDGFERRGELGLGELLADGDVAGGSHVLASGEGPGALEADGAADQRVAHALGPAFDVGAPHDDAPALAQQPLVAVELVVGLERAAVLDVVEGGAPGGLGAEPVEGGRLRGGGEVGEGGQEPGHAHSRSVRPRRRRRAARRRTRVPPMVAASSGPCGPQPSW